MSIVGSVFKPIEKSINQNLEACCVDLTRLKATGLYPEGSKIQKLARQLTEIDGVHVSYLNALSIVETMVNEAAWQFVIKNS